MKLKDIYNLFIKMGKENDPRPMNEIERVLFQTQKEFDKLPDDEKIYFDQDRLFNPYNDTRILFGDQDAEVHSILVGIDMETAEILLADRLKEKGQRIDLVLTHHPEGKALAGLFRVMHMQEDILAHTGMSINVAEGILASRISEVERGLMPLNHNRAIDAAKLFDIPFMCCHTPADNMVNTYLTRMYDNKIPETVGDVVKLLLEIPEYQQANKIGAGPKIVSGSKEKRAGKILVDMTGGTGGSEDAYAKLAIAGVGTIVCMHIGEKHRKEAEKNHINVVIAGHMASDSLGMNFILDALAEKGIEIISCSGLIRVKR